MTEGSTHVESILEYADLAISRRFGSLPLEERQRMDALEEALRDIIEGARPAPRNIGGRPADKQPPRRSVSSSAGAPPARVVAVTAAETTESAPGPKSQLNSEPPLRISGSDKNKIKEIAQEKISPSRYTPSQSPAFLGDYYSEGIVVPATAPATVPTNVRRADGEAGDALRSEARVLLGLSAQEAPGAPEEVKPVPYVPDQEARERPANIHIVSGGVRKGRILDFDPDAESLRLAEDKKGITKIHIKDVLVIAFGATEGAEPSQPMGQHVVVRLVNGRQVSGMSSNYSERSQHFTLTPEERRGNVDHIWVPASAVQDVTVH